MTQNNSKLVIVTGGSRGLGLATVKRLATAGYRVIAASRTDSPELRELIASNDKITFSRLDLSQHSNLHAWVTETVQQHGVPYSLINNAALAHDGILGTMHESQIEEVIAINVTATLILTKYISRTMLRGRQGRIVNVSSIIASTGFNGLSVYAASKAALNGFTKSLARELGKANITVNALAPGYMQTDMTAGINHNQLEQITRRSALRRLASTDEAASTIEYLLSPAAAAITGTILTVDAGNTA